MRKRLIYLSNCAVHPDGKLDPFLTQELPWLTKHFDSVMVVSHYGVWTATGDVQHQPKPSRPTPVTLLSFLKALGLRDLWVETLRLLRDGHFSPKNWLKLLAFAQRGVQMHEWTEWLLREHGGGDITLYSFWMSFDAYAAALTKRKHPHMRFMARGHAFDIDLERNPMNPYLMKQAIVDAADELYPISRTAQSQLLAYMKSRIDESKLHVLAMGSGGSPIRKLDEAPRFSQGILRVVSCAMIIPIKQVDVIVEALSRWEGDLLCWTHIGGGEGEEALHALISEKLDHKENVICELLGTMSAEQVSKLYHRRTFDVFVNSSRKEGMPVSIMEAMRHGIPVIAPTVGGIPELITPEVGYLYDPAQGVDGLLEKLQLLSHLSAEETAQMRRNAKERWNAEYCSEALLPRLFEQK